MDTHFLALPLFAFAVAASPHARLNQKSILLLFAAGLLLLLAVVLLAIFLGRDYGLVLVLRDPHWLWNAVAWWSYVLIVGSIFRFVRLGYRYVEKYINEKYVA